MSTQIIIRISPAYIEDLWDRTGNKLKEKGVNEETIKETIREYRKEQNEGSIIEI